MKLSNWMVEGYKSLEEEHQLEIGEITVLVGENNTGKSSVIDSLVDYRKAFPVGDGLEESWVQRRTTGKLLSNPVRFEFKFILSDEERETILRSIVANEVLSERDMEKFLDRGDFEKITHELILSAGVEEPNRSEFRTNFKGDEIFLRKDDGTSNPRYLSFNRLPNIEYTDRKREWVIFWNHMKERMDSWTVAGAFRKPKDKQGVQRVENLLDDGRNLTRVLLTLSGEKDDRFDIISDAYSGIMHGVDKIRTPLRDEHNTTVVVDEEQFDNGFELSEISAGSKEILTLITQIVLAGDDTDFLLIEEPELHLHPGAEQQIYDLIDEMLLDKGPQVIISTHSNVFVRQKRVENVVIVERDGSTTLREVDSRKVGMELKGLGYEYSGMLESDAVVFVEGRSDKTIFRCLGKKYEFDFDENKVAVVDLENRAVMEKHSISLVKLLYEFGISYLFIADSDGDPPNHFKGDLISRINRTDEDEDDSEPTEVYWERADDSNVHVWEEDEIEAYLLEDKNAVAEALDIELELVEELLIEHDEKKPADQLKLLCKEAKPDLDSDLEEFDKIQDTYNIAKRVNLGELPEEFHDVMEKIADLVNESDTIRRNRP